MSVSNNRSYKSRSMGHTFLPDQYSPAKAGRSTFFNACSSTLAWSQRINSLSDEGEFWQKKNMLMVQLRFVRYCFYVEYHGVRYSIILNIARHGSSFSLNCWSFAWCNTPCKHHCDLKNWRILEWIIRSSVRLIGPCFTSLMQME